MTDDHIGNDVPALVSPRERAGAVSKALKEAARRARFSKRHPRHIKTGTYRRRRGDTLFRLIRLVTFVGIVVVPGLSAILYYGWVASDQYVSEARFTVRGGTPPKLDGIGSLTGVPSILIIQDTQVILNYLQSRAIVEQLDTSVGLRAIYGRDSIDVFSRLDADARIEKFVRYWKSMIGLSVEMPSGIVVFTVRAFSPDDAARVAAAAIAASETMVNQMNGQMIDDTLAAAERERQRAEIGLATARANLEGARNKEGTLSAEQSADALNGLMTQVRGDLVKMQQDYDTMRRDVSEDSPQLRLLRLRITAANDEIDKLQAELTQAPDRETTKNLAGSMSRLDYLTLENQIAEKTYASSLSLLEQARLASETKIMYINTFVHPARAEEATYPRRLIDIGLSIAAASAAWGCLVGLLAFVRARLARSDPGR